MSETTATDTQRTAEYEHLRRKRKETEGTIELAEVVDVWVGDTEVVCRFQFDWASDPICRSYDLDADRDIAKLETLCETNGLDFEQLPHLEGTLLELRYTGSRWEPTATDAYNKNEGSLIETFRAECHLLAREMASSPAFVRNGIARVRELTMTQTIIAVLLVKKVIIIALLAYVML